MYYNLLAVNMEVILLPAIILLLVGGLVWSSYSSRKRQKSAMEMINKIAVGDKIKTIGGICGVVVETNDEENTFVLETGTDDNKSYIKFDKQAIYQAENKNAPEEQVTYESTDEIAADETAPEELKEATEAEEKEDKE